MVTESPLYGRIARQAASVRPAQVAGVFTVKENWFIQISDTSGKQVADFIAFNLNDFDEYLSTSQTRAANNSLMLREGYGLFSNRRSRMFTLIADTVGRHDMLFPMCDEQRYLDDYGIEGHASCRGNFQRALHLRGHEISGDRLPDPVHWFMHVALKGRGEFEVREPLSRRNDNVLLKAHMDTLVLVSACPQDQNACNAFNPTDILVRIYQ